MKAAIVTGASRGLGRATALALAKEGYALALCARYEFSDVIKELNGMGATTMMRMFDVRRYDSVQWFVEDVMSVYGRIDVLVNNAGHATPRTDLESLRRSDIRQIVNTNLFGTTWLLMKVLPIMKAQGSGTIVNIGSKAGRYPSPGAAMYSASKAAVHALTQAVAREVRDTKIRVVTVSPGPMNTEMRQTTDGDAAQQQSPEFVAGIISDVVTGRLTWAPDILYPKSRVSLPSGADVLVWKNNVHVFPMEELK